MPPKKQIKSNKEAMRAHRAKMKANPAAHEAYLKKEKERYQRRKATGKLKTIQDFNHRHQRQLRKKWRLEKRKQRRTVCKRRAEVENVNTPPSSPEREEAPQSGQKLRGRKKLRKEERKAYRTIKKQEQTIKRLTNTVQVLQRKMEKSKKEPNKEHHVLSGLDSPATKANKALASGNDTVRRELVFGYAIQREIKKNIQQQKKKRAIHESIVGPILKKYRLYEKAKKELKCTQKLISSIRKGPKPRKKTATSTVVREFFEQDTNSTPCAGKREVITRKKEKRQRRYLTDSMLNLYRKFRAEHPNIKVSYTVFTRLRPFHVLPPSVNRRDTVKCKMHHNAELKAQKLHAAGIIKSLNLNNLMALVVCSDKSELCMYGKCRKCKPLESIYRDVSPKTQEQEINYYEWSRSTDTRSTNRGEINVKQVAKEVKSSTIASLCEAFEKELQKIMPHQYRIYHQYEQIRSIKSKLCTNECVLQVDYSENYACKAETEIQAMHFGASRKQVTLHTSHATLVDASGKLYTKCYCTLSEDSRHGPAAVWAHLSPVISDLKQMGIDTLHVVSDGPTTQYRNKSNFQMMATVPFQKWNMKYVTWTLLEASHGKGPADGIGAAIKGRADRLVATGKDILNCQQMVAALADTSTVKIVEITTEDINNMGRELDGQMSPIKGTMEIHQLLAPSVGTLYHRKLACFCTKMCTCHNLVKVKDLKPKVLTSTVSKVEAQLTQAQVQLFQRRWVEGYDVNVLDLSTLTADEKEEFLYWRTWRAAKLEEDAKEGTSKGLQRGGDVIADSGSLSDNSGSLSDNSDSLSDDSEFQCDDRESSIDEVESVHDDEPECLSNVSEDEEVSVYDKESNTDERPSPALQTGSYYAVFFMMRRRKTFYIGSLTHQVQDNNEEVEMKFLEKRLVKSRLMFDWPKRDDICPVDRKAVLQEVNFKGPPPFSLDEKTAKHISESLTRLQL